MVRAFDPLLLRRARCCGVTGVNPGTLEQSSGGRADGLAVSQALIKLAPSGAGARASHRGVHVSKVSKRV